MVEWKDDPVARFRRIESLYQAAFDMPEVERPAFLDRECSDDISLRREVENLLAARSEAGNFLSIPAFEIEVGRHSDETQDGACRSGFTSSLIGRTIKQYEIVSPIGRGGMGEVWLAEDTRLNRQVALKLLPEEFAGDPGRVRRFEQEGRAVLALNHPNIITLYDFGHADEGYYIATEFVDGEDLRIRMRDGRRLSVTDSIEIALQLCSALAMAHEIGIVHRDIKPENVVLRPDGYVKLLDFGLAKISEAAGSRDSGSTQSRLTSPGMVIGTTNYMSPEQARGQSVDGRSDIFSLGALLYELLTGRPAFEGDTASDIIASILRSDPPPLTGLLAGSLPGAAIDPLQKVIDRALDKDREKRYRTATEMAADLNDAIEQLRFREMVTRSGDNLPIEPVAAVPPAVSDPRSRWPIAASVFLLLSAVCAGLLIWRNYRSSPQPVAAPPMRTLAVLPFRFIGSDRNEEYLGEGMTEGLITRLANSGQLTVRPISAVLGYRQHQVEPDIAARELVCDLIITGSLQRAGSRLRVYVQMNSSGESQPLWTGEFDGVDADLFSLQDTVALRVIRELSFILTPEQKELLSRPMTSNPEAYRLYLQARYFQNKRSPESLLRARSGFEQAIALDENFAMAHVNLAYCLSALSERGLVPVAEAVKRQLIHAERAVKLDDRLAEAHALLGFYKLAYGWDLVKADAGFRRALELDDLPWVTLTLSPAETKKPAGSSLIYNCQGKYREGIISCLSYTSGWVIDRRLWQSSMIHIVTLSRQ